MATRILNESLRKMEEALNAIANCLKNQQELMQKILDGGNANNGNVPQNLSNTESILYNLSNQITEFQYDPDSNSFFGSWYKRFKSLFLNDTNNLNDAAKVQLLLRKLQTTCHERYLSLILPKAPEDFTFEETVKKLTAMFGPQKTLFNQRFECLQLEKKSSEDFVTYGGRINRHCENFQLDKLTANQFKALIFICGLRSSLDAEIRTRLLQRFSSDTTDSLDIEKLVEETNTLINLRKDTSMIEKSAHSQPNVKAVSNQSRNSDKIKKQHPKHETKSIKNKSDSDKSAKLPGSPCWSCGAMHFSKDCSFLNHKCKMCNLVGHKEGYCSCFNKNKSNKHKNVKGLVAINKISSNRKYIDIIINGVSATLQIDTASDISVISQETWKHIGSPCLLSTTLTATDASNNHLQFDGEFPCSIEFNGQIKNTTCYVSTSSNLDLFGNDWLELFNLWSTPLNAISKNIIASVSISKNISHLKQQFPKLFTETLGLCTKVKVNIYKKPDAKPIFKAKRPVAYAALQPIEEELIRLQRLGIIHPVDYSNWAAPIVVVRKSNGKIRICGDYSTGLNDSLESHRFPLPLPEEIFNKISNGKMFSHIDLSDAFLQVQVDDESAEMLTINTHRGLFRFNRLPPGVKTAPALFQQIMSAMVSGLDKTAAYMDDVIVSGTDETEHQSNLLKLLTRIQEYGFQLRIEKCEFYMSSIKYLGHVIDHQGIRPDPQKIESITNMPPPTDVPSLQSYLGAINYYGKFVDKIHSLRKPLDSLLTKQAIWNWTPECQKSFNEFKEILKSDLLLTHYDPSKQIIVAADASNTGIGAVIMHRFEDNSIKAIMHASRTLTSAERNYSQIEKEALGLIFAVTKFHRMIYGRKFILQTDHKPLLSIFGSKKGIPVYTANRLQRWALTLLLYDFKIEYISTNSFGYADILSRLINHHVLQDEDYIIASIHSDEELMFIQNDVFNHFPITHKMIKETTSKSKILQQIIQYIRHGWPSDDKQIENDEIKKFYKRKFSLSEVNGCIMFGDRIVIPKQFQHKILTQLHKGHQGIERMKSISRSYVYWPSIDSQIENMAKTCTSCSSIMKAPTKTNLESWPIPDGPWQRIHIDYAGPIDDKFYLVIVDPYSKWPEIFVTKSTTSLSTIKLLEDSFSRYGLPKVIVSDNGTQFTSTEFAEFCQINGIQHIRTAPYHPQSNGQAEIFVSTLKRALKKIGGTADNALREFLSTYRTTPNPNCINGLSPAQVMFGRKLRTTFDLLIPEISSGEDVEPDDRKIKQNEQFNKKHGTKPKQFEISDPVFVKIHRRNTFEWIPAKVIERIGKVMYNVILEDNSRLVRAHCNQMRTRVVNSSSSKNDNSKSDSYSLPLQILLDEFEINSQFSHAIDDLPTADHSARRLSQNEMQSEVNCYNSEIEEEPEIENEPQPHVDIKAAPIEVAPPIRRSTRSSRIPRYYHPYLLY